MLKVLRTYPLQPLTYKELKSVKVLRHPDHLDWIWLARYLTWIIIEIFGSQYIQDVQPSPGTPNLTNLKKYKELTADTI